MLGSVEGFNVPKAGGLRGRKLSATYKHSPGWWWTRQGRQERQPVQSCCSGVQPTQLQRLACVNNWHIFAFRRQIPSGSWAWQHDTLA